MGVEKKLPCPFCNGKVTVKSYVDEGFSMECDTCYAGATNFTSLEAILEQYKLFKKLGSKNVQ